MKLYFVAVLFAIVSMLSACEKPTKKEINACKAHGNLAVYYERLRMRGVDKSTISEESIGAEEAMTQEDINRQLDLLDSVFTRELGENIESIRENAEKDCLKRHSLFYAIFN